MDSIFDLVGKVGSVVAQTGKTVGSVVAEKAQEAKGFAKDTATIASIKNQINAANDIIKSSYEALGEYYYGKYTGEVDASEQEPEVVVNSIRAIDNAKKLIEEYQAKIEDIKVAQAEYKAAKDAAADGAEDIIVEATEVVDEAEVAESVDDELAQVKENLD